MLVGNRANEKKLEMNDRTRVNRFSKKKRWV